MMNEEIKQLVHGAYYDNDNNCATTMIESPAEVFDLKLSPAIRRTARHARCGRLWSSVWIGRGGRHNYREKQYEYPTACIVKKIGSLEHRILRNEGFKADNPPHLCEPLTVLTINFAIEFIQSYQKGFRFR